MSSCFYTSSAHKIKLGILQFEMPSPFYKGQNKNFNFFEIHSHLVYFAYTRGYMSSISYWQPPKLAFRLPLLLQTWADASTLVLYFRENWKCYISQCLALFIMDKMMVSFYQKYTLMWFILHTKEVICHLFHTGSLQNLLLDWFWY